MTGDELRIGDQERDAAIDMLQEHMSAGRLTAEEFNDRMSRALEARTRSDLAVLFTDLPSPRPPQLDRPTTPRPDWSQTDPMPTYGTPAPTYGAPSYGQPPVPGHRGRHRRGGLSMHGRPWYTQWWLLIVAVLLTSATGGRVGFIVPLVAIWIFVIAPSIAGGRQAAVEEPPHVPPRPLTFYEREELIAEIRADRPMTAIRRYRELTGADLITARIEVEKLRREIGG